MTKVAELLKNIYYNAKHPASFSSVRKLYNAARKESKNLKPKDVKRWLNEQNTYTLHRPARRYYRRNKIYVNYINNEWQADLVDMTMFKKENDGYSYI